MGYHMREIQKGKLGEISKVQEEVDEFKDALEQGNKVLQMCELCDIYGALEALARPYGLSMKDLQRMSDRTVSAFSDGSR